jgi:DMSO/TMAO reductase YedYZ molybdopterin-dependent catalytic subunit
MNASRIPPGQQLAAPGKWPLVGERVPAAAPDCWTIEIRGLVEMPQTLTLDELKSLPQTELTTDIHCVTRWSRLDMHFHGVLLAEFLRRAAPLSSAKFLSFVANSTRGHSTSLPIEDALRQGALLAFECNGEEISCEHGGPVRTIVPGRYFYKSLKWLKRIEVLQQDRLGYWEAESGYHNEADPWREQRYAAANLAKAEVARLLAARDFSGHDLRSVELSSADLAGLRAVKSLLRDSRFKNANLAGADFTGANLSNAQLCGASLRDAVFLGADVEGADFTSADLRGATFLGASLFGASLHTDGAAPAKLDATTRFSSAVLDQLTPIQADFLRASDAAIED